MKYKVCIVGFGEIGSAVSKGFNDKGISHKIYDKYKKIGKESDMANSDLCIVCVSTPNIDGAMYNLNEIYECLDYLQSSSYEGEVCIKSPLVPGTTSNFDKKYDFIIYNSPYFYKDASNIAIGTRYLNSYYERICRQYFLGDVIVVGPSESECAAIFHNSFFAIKSMIFEEFSDICKNKNLEFSIIKEVMLRNKNINISNILGKKDESQSLKSFDDLKSLCEFAERSLSCNRIMKSAIYENEILKKGMSHERY